MSEYLKRRIEIYSDPDMLFELEGFNDVADVMQCALQEIERLQRERDELRQKSIAACGCQIDDRGFFVSQCDKHLDIAHQLDTAIAKLLDQQKRPSEDDL